MRVIADFERRLGLKGGYLTLGYLLDILHEALFLLWIRDPTQFCGTGRLFMLFKAVLSLVRVYGTFLSEIEFRFEMH
jgi:hypothetical protein